MPENPIDTVVVELTVIQANGRERMRRLTMTPRNTKFELGELARVLEMALDEVKELSQWDDYHAQTLARINPGTNMPVPEPTGAIKDVTEIIPGLGTDGKRPDWLNDSEARALIEVYKLNVQSMKPLNAAWRCIHRAFFDHDDGSPQPTHEQAVAAVGWLMMGEWA